MMGGFGEMWGVGMFFWVILLGLFVWAVIAATSRTGAVAQQDSARAILDERFAKGELPVDEYRKLRAALR